MSLNATYKEIAEWHREQAKQHEAKAKKHWAVVEVLLEDESPKSTSESRHVANGVTVSLQDFEASLEHKGGRIAHLATRFNTTPEAIETLLAMPECRYEVGERGFIYPKQK